MLPEECVTLCRICLNDGALFPIFEHNENSVYKKLCTCLNEKIEDVDGYPRRICLQCNNKLNSVCEFINKYKESCKILQYGNVIVKEEILFGNNYNEQSNLSEPEFSSDIKMETPGSDDQTCLIEFFPETKINIKKATDTPKSIQKPKAHRKPRTAKIVKRKATTVATCILEGNFVWIGEKWCSSKEASDVKFTDPETQKQERKHKIDLKRQIKRVKTMEKPKSPPVKLCDLCGEVFENKEKLERHRNHVHFPKKYTCPKCPKVFNTVYKLNRHVKRLHDTKKDFICAKCGKEFAYLSEMNSHIRKVHNKKNGAAKRVFACTLCDKTYACQKSVIIHERSVHTGERPAVCTVCESTFFHEDYLKEHMRLHTGETPYKCPVCGRGYAQRCNMKSHIKQHRISDLDSGQLSKIKPNYLRLMKP